MKRPTYPNYKTAERIQKVFTDKHLTDLQVAVMIEVDRKTVFAYRNGLRDPSIKFIRYLCSTYHISSDWLLCLE